MPTLRRTFSAGVLIGLVLVLAGCMKVDRALRFNSDGSGAYVLTVGFREPTPGDPGSVAPNVVSTMEVFAAHVEQGGGAHRRYEQDGYAYWSFTRTFSSVTEANALLKDDPRQFDANKSPLLFRDDVQVSEESSPFSKGLRVSGHLSLADPFGKAQEWRDAVETLSVTMLEGIQSASGVTQDGDTVTYTVRYNESVPVDVRGGVGQPGLSFPPQALLFGAIMLGVLAGALIAPGARLIRSVAKR